VSADLVSVSGDIMAVSRGMICALLRRSRPVASFTAMRTSQVDSLLSARKPDRARQARIQAS